jgi:SAM-dependent methyltransferase
MTAIAGMDWTKRLFDSCDRRLIYASGQKASPDFWDSNWQGFSLDRNTLLANKDSAWAQITKEFLEPDAGPILEGGCGPGTHVAALRNLGFQVIGVDFAQKIVQTLNRIVPELDIRVADVRQLPIEDGSMAEYWSVGVIEHFWEGYAPIAHEMFRVLRPGGLLFLCYPYMCKIRTWKARLRFFRQWRGGDVEGFYQFALNPRSVRANYERLGFEIVEERPVMGRQGMQEEAPAMSRFIQRVYAIRSRSMPCRIFIRAVHELNVRLEPWFSYSILQIYRKPNGRPTGRQEPATDAR